MNILMQRDLLTEYRKKRKEEFDKVINLSTGLEDGRFFGGETARLIDDGTIVDGTGNPWFYIKKGTVKQFYEDLSDDFVGYITLAHFKFSEFPFILGEWRKRDLSLVDNGDGFYGLDVNLHLDEESIFVKELRRLGYTLGISSELKGNENKELSAKINIPVVDKLDIPGFSVVGNAGNVNSSGINLGGAK